MYPKRTTRSTRSTRSKSQSFPTPSQSNSDASNEVSINSFHGWPHKNPSITSMVHAGFVYRPKHSGDDTVACLLCKIELYEWVENDNPIKEHQLQSPTCPFLLTLTEPSNPKKVKKEPLDSTPSTPSTSTSTVSLSWLSHSKSTKLKKEIPEIIIIHSPSVVLNSSTTHHHAPPSSSSIPIPTPTPMVPSLAQVRATKKKKLLDVIAKPSGPPPFLLSPSTTTLNSDPIPSSFHSLDDHKRTEPLNSSNFTQKSAFSNDPSSVPLIPIIKQEKEEEKVSFEKETFTPLIPLKTPTPPKTKFHRGVHEDKAPMEKSLSSSLLKTTQRNTSPLTFIPKSESSLSSSSSSSFSSLPHDPFLTSSTPTSAAPKDALESKSHRVHPQQQQQQQLYEQHQGSEQDNELLIDEFIQPWVPSTTTTKTQTSRTVLFNEPSSPLSFFSSTPTSMPSLLSSVALSPSLQISSTSPSFRPSTSSTSSRLLALRDLEQIPSATKNYLSTFLNAYESMLPNEMTLKEFSDFILYLRLYQLLQRPYARFMTLKRLLPSEWVLEMHEDVKENDKNKDSQEEKEEKDSLRKENEHTQGAKGKVKHRNDLETIHDSKGTKNEVQSKKRKGEEGEGGEGGRGKMLKLEATWHSIHQYFSTQQFLSSFTLASSSSSSSSSSSFTSSC